MSPNEFLHTVLDGGYIAFMIDDLSALPGSKDVYLYPRPKYPNEMGILYFTTMGYRCKDDKNDTVSEEQYRNLPPASRQRYVECYLIHIPKATWELYRNNTPFVAQIVVDIYNQVFPQNAVNVESLWSERARAMGVSDVDFFFVEHAERMRNVEYLRRLSKGISKDEDPYGNLARAAAEALRRLGH